MSRNLILTFFVSALCYAPAHAITFDWATVSNPGNADDTQYDSAGFGGVNYTFRISKHEITNAQYAEFLNAVDSSGANTNLGGDDPFLYNSLMSSHAFGGISFDAAAANGSKYEIKSGRGNNPVVFVSFFDAMRFVNWLENGQGSGGTESGVYTIGSGFDEVRDPSATYFIPSEDEWYKAAYYDPNRSVYYDYPTGTDAEPYSDNPNSLNTPDDTNVANFRKDDGTANAYDDGFAVTGSNSYDSSQNYLTDVGAYSLATSPYGTYDQGGNVTEWNEKSVDGLRGVRGGSFQGSMFDMHRNDFDSTYAGGPEVESWSIGFRVATVPEPSTVLLAVTSAMGLLLPPVRSIVSKLTFLN